MRYLLIFLSLCCGLAFADPAATPNSNPHKPIVVTAENATVTIHLASNATTGYQWFFLRDRTDRQLKLQSYRYIAPETGLMGAPGAVEFVFQVSENAFRAPEVLNLNLEYARPFELKSKHLHRTRFVIVTEPQ